ncbi:MAG: hypothetical protein JSS10_07730 [Verrucomicrobia bacterium]|nr:hypothetical protein [Verrucomicrobiota bacterium]
MTTVLPAGGHGTKFEPVELKQSQPLPADLEQLSEQTYADSNIHGYKAKLEQHEVNVGMLLPGIGMAQEALRDQRLAAKNTQLHEERQNLDAITTFLDKVNQQKNNKVIDFTGENELLDRLKSILPDEKRLSNPQMKREDAELLCRALTRKSENHITPKIEEITTDMTHIIEDLDKILPILKEMLQAYARLIERINGNRR